MTTPEFSWLIGSIFTIVLLFLIFLFIRRRKVTKRDKNNQIYIGNLSYSANEYNLKQLFERYGRICSIRIVKDARTRRSKGFAFITYSSAKEANEALAAHGKDLKGRTLVVRIAKLKSE